MSTSSAFQQLAEGIQRFLWAEGWEELRDAQELAIPLILPGNRDIVVAASTAAGKTEAAFLPALTHLLRQEPPGLIVYVSPLKALINDQFGRLDRLCESLDIPVWPWHGDISNSSKTGFLRRPFGVLLITPESLEALLCNRGTSVAGIFERLTFFVVDELHAFIGSERGKQLQSLMHRIERVLNHPVPRIGLSATLGDMELAAQFLRPGGSAAIISAPSSGQALKVLVKGFEESAPNEEIAPEHGQEQEGAQLAIASHLFKVLRGSNNLVFPNSRREVERYTHLLNEACKKANSPNEFWPHHGSLSREIRHETETALKRKDRSATAICTNTLELGIDIGAVRSVVQIGPPPSVANLRQRLGRSGRRKGEAAILRGYVIEDELDDQPSLDSALRLDTVQTAAAVSLALENWFEPPAAHGAHLSTLIQQLLSSIAQYGGLHAGQAYRLLCDAGAPFSDVSRQEFVELLRHLGQLEVLTQDSSGLLLHGRLGDKFVNHYSFFAAFSTDEEFRIVTAGKALGTLPISQMLCVGQRILFGGRTWLVEDIDTPHKTIHVSPGKGGAPPSFNGGGGRVHTRVRQRMRELYLGTGQLPFLDPTAQRFLDEGRNTFRRLVLDKAAILDQGEYAVLTTWLGDSTNEAIACLLASRRIRAYSARLGVEIRKKDMSLDDLHDVLADVASEPVPPVDELLAHADNLAKEKWDWLLSPHLLHITYASSNLNLAEALSWLNRTFR